MMPFVLEYLVFIIFMFEVNHSVECNYSEMLDGILNRSVEL